MTAKRNQVEARDVCPEPVNKADEGSGASAKCPERHGLCGRG